MSKLFKKLTTIVSTKKRNDTLNIKKSRSDTVVKEIDPNDDKVEYYLTNNREFEVFALSDEKIVNDTYFDEHFKDQSCHSSILNELLKDRFYGIPSIADLEYVQQSKEPKRFIIPEEPEKQPKSLRDSIRKTIKSEISVGTGSTFSEDPVIFDPKVLKTGITPEDFEFIKTIGKGYFGKVSQVRYKKDGQMYALKSLKKAKIKETKHIEHTKMERKILEKINHPFIVSLKFAFQTEPKLYIVMDYHNGGELFFHLRKKKRFSIDEARFYFAQLVLAIDFLHQNHIIYRDLKPENIVLDSKGYIKLTDFGLAKDNIDNYMGCTQTFCGTPEYLAPEILRNDKYGWGVDIWCLGIILFEMIFGFPPFYDKNKDKLYRKIIFNEPDFSKTKVVIDDSTKDVILKLLEKNPNSRIKMAELKKHPFFKPINLDDIYKMNLTAPFQPSESGEDDYKYIDPNIKQIVGDSLYIGMSLDKNVDFGDFTYIDNNILKK